MLPPLKRHEIQVLRRAGLSLAEVARLAGVSKRTVQRVDDEDEIVDVDASAVARARKVGRPSKAEQFRALVSRLLVEDPEMMSLEILRRARLDGYAGGKSAMYELIAEMRPARKRALVRFEGLPGEFSQHDFGHVDVHFVDGSKKRVHFFASRLKYSRWVQVSIVQDERVETLVRSLVDHFAAIGGVPLLAVFDRPKTVVLEWKKDGTPTQWNSTFAQVMLELGVGVELCWPASGNQKGSVERLVGWIKGSFFKPRRFLDDADLEQQLQRWHTEVNTQLPSRATKVTPAERMLEERPRLRPLRVRPDKLALPFPVVVGPTGVVRHDGDPYSMPAEAIGLSGTLYLYRDRVRITAGRYEALHGRCDGSGKGSILPEHRAQMVAAVSGKRAKRYYKREQILALGDSAHAFLTELVHRRPNRWSHDVDRLFALLQKHGDESVRAAIDQALSQHAFGAEYVAQILGEVDAHVVLPFRRPREGGR
jgi:transposase